MAMANRNVVSKVVSAAEVEHLTREGWRLVEVLQESYVEPFHESVPFIVPGQNYTTSGSGTKGFLVSKNLFLMAQDGSTALQEAAAAAQKQYVELCETRTQLTEAAANLKVVNTELASSKRGHTLLEETNARNYKQFSEQRTLNQKMENDIAKIRQAVGELKMKEILGQ